MNRRDLLTRIALVSAVGLPISDLLRLTDWIAEPRTLNRPMPALDEFPWAEVGRQLRARFADLERHFIFEYYPWYDSDPWRHWQQWQRNPPPDMAATSVPKLGPYDSGDLKVLERHARWIVQSGAGAVNLSWWGRSSYSGSLVHRVMDVMADHDIKVTFHLEPYAVDRGRRYADDIVYLVREFGDRRNWDCMLLLSNADGTTGPVFKSFRTIIKPIVVDCHGVANSNDDYTSDVAWRSQIDTVRTTLRDDFDHVTLLADSGNVKRVEAARFDGIAIYSNVREPSSWPTDAEGATERDLIFSFNCNPGFDSIARRNVPEDSCYVPPTFVPATDPIDWGRPSERERARTLSEERIAQTLATTLFLQTDQDLLNYQRGFFLVHINSFNEWHEGHAFEPAKNYRALSPEERAIGYHNARRGNYRFRTLRRLLKKVLRG